MDFFFSVASTYTYLTVNRIEKVAADAGVPVRWRPFHLRTITTEQNNRPFVGKPVKMAYMWRDVERRAAQHGIGFNGIPPYPVDADSFAHRMTALAAAEGWCPEFTKELYRRWFLEHRAPGEPAELREIVRGLDRDPEAAMARAESEENRARLVADTDAARELGIFGSPTFVVGREVFWGDDRLEIALEWARREGR